MQKVANEGNLGNTSVEQAQPTIDIQEVIQGINDRMNKAEEGSMETGEYMLDTVFQGSLSEALSRNPYKNKSLKQVCDDPKLLVDRRVLGTCVKAAYLRRYLIAAEVDCSKLSYSHFVALLRAPDETKRRELAGEANSLAWSVRRLTEEVNAMKQSGNGVGRVKDLVKKMEAPWLFLEDEGIKKLLQDPNEMKQLESLDRLLIARSIDKILAKMASSTDILKRAKRNIALFELGDIESAA